MCESSRWGEEDRKRNGEAERGGGGAHLCGEAALVQLPHARVDLLADQPLVLGVVARAGDRQPFLLQGLRCWPLTGN